MGGGSMMRATAKLAEIGVVNSGLRCSVVPESSISAAARHIGAIGAKSSSDSVKASVAIDAPSVEKPCWGKIHDWEFAGVEEEIIAGSGDPLPRLVFGGAPTFEEAPPLNSKMSSRSTPVFVSSPRSGGYGSLYGAGHSSGMSQLSNSEVFENKACLTSAPSTPEHAIQAFRFLDQSPELQAVVASIVSNPNVWNAVLQTPALQGYIQSEVADNPNVYQNVGESLAQGDIHYQESPTSFEVCSADGDVLDQTSPRRFDASSETGKSDAGESNSKNKFRYFWGKSDGAFRYFWGKSDAAFQYCWGKSDAAFRYFWGKSDTGESNSKNKFRYFWGKSDAGESNSKNKFRYFGGKSDGGESNSKNKFRYFWEMMSNLSDFFNSFFGAQGDNEGTENTNSFPDFEKRLHLNLIMGVVVMVIMLVVLKRA